MSFTWWIFYSFIFLAALAALGILFSKNVFKSSLLLLACLLAVAAIYVLSFAEFVAVTQILLYAGGILIVILFGVMLTTRIDGKSLRVTNNHILNGILASATVLSVLIGVIKNSDFASPAPALPADKTIEAIGIGLMTDFALPFEVAGILLLVALIGAAVVTSLMKTKNQ